MPTNAAPQVVVYGTVCLDRFVFAPTNDDLASSEARELPGGEAFNTATALVGWGVSVLLTGTALGNEPEAGRLRELLDTHPLGVSRAFVPEIAHAITPVCTVRVFPDGERHMSGKGFSHAVSPPPLPDSVFATQPVFAVDPNLGTPAIQEALRAARFGCPVVAMDFDTCPDVVERSRIVVTSRETLQKHGNTNPPEVVVRELMEQGAQTAVVTLGAQGSVCCDRETGLFSVSAFAVPGIVDTTGAGDTFRAGLCWGLLNGFALPEMLRFASAAAALHCCVVGGGSRPNLDDVLRLAQNNNETKDA